MKFLSYKQKDMVHRALKLKMEIMCKNQRFRFYNDVAMDVHKQCKKFDTVQQQLCQLGLRHGTIPPATLVLTYEKVHRLSTAAKAHHFVKMIEQEKNVLVNTRTA